VWFLLILNFAGKVAAWLLGAAEPAAAAFLWLTPDALIAYHLFVPHAQGLMRNARRFSTPRREVWLTIDDGPDPQDTPRLLELLARYDARATFFVIGENAQARPGLIQAIVNAGHEVAHHTHTHPVGSFWCASPARLARELDTGLAVLRASGVAPTRFRPPVGIKNLWLASALKRRGLVCVGWSARGLERRRGDADDVVGRVLRGVKAGDILLLHEGPRVPAAIRIVAIERTLKKLRELGFTCIVPTAGQLIDP